MLIELFFLFSIFFILYAYFGYPLILMAISLFRNQNVKKGDITPMAAFIITAYNEEKRIREKIENTLKQDYPKDKLEIIIASDCSSDKTDEIIKSYQAQGVKLVRALERRGKENAQRYAVDTAAGDILIFSDVATILKPDGISNIVKNFNDPTVGCVSSEDRFIDSDGKISGEGAYVRYEMFLRNLETKVNTLVGLSGSFFAARKEVCRNWASDLQSDFNTLLNSVKIGLRGVSDPESIGYYKNIANEKKEFDRKVRTVIRGIAVFMKSLPMLNPFKYGFFSWQLFSHKLCRWLVPFAMIIAFLSNFFLILNSFLTSASTLSSISSSASTFDIYLYTFLLQLVFYSLAILGIYIKYSTLASTLTSNLLKIPSFFVLVNLSILNAWYRYLKGERLIAWEPSKR
ncbi:MAG: glycosyltransferase family 2 protein [Nitrospirae bacterium]|nr:glycosyltransferase family 2 protein [Nitrospirota bacterium]